MRKSMISMICFILFLIMGLTGCGVSIVPANQNGIKSDQDFEKITTNSSEKVTLNIVDWSDSTKEARKKLNEKFEQDHPNVTINYTTLTQAQFNETMISGIRSGNAPDLFPLPNNANFQTAVDEGWFIPLNIYLDDYFFGQFKEGTLQQNVTSMGGKVYLLPEAQEIPSTLMFYNKELLTDTEKEIIDSDSMTWSDFQAIAQRVSNEGDGKVYGMVTSGAQKNRTDLELRAFSELAGSALGPGEQIFLKEGQPLYDSKGVVNAFSWYEQMIEKNVFHPDSASITAPEARNIFAEGKAAFIVQGSWCIPSWENQKSGLDFGVMKLPIPNQGESMMNKQIRPFTKGWMGISSSSAHPDIAAEYLKSLYSYEYQNDLLQAGGFISIRKDLTEENISNERMKDYYRLAMEQSLEIENPITNDKNLQLIYGIIQPIQPDFGDIASGLLSGRKDYAERLYEYNDKLKKNLEQAVSVVNKENPVKIEDFEINVN